MAVKNSELYSTLWKCCDELRGGMDASQYKDYVLVILFVKYISDKKRNDEGFDIDIPDKFTAFSSTKDTVSSDTFEANVIG